MAEVLKVSGDLLTVDSQYVAHQCNCVTEHARGLSATLFRRFPWANTYAGRTQPDPPGTISVHGDGLGQRYVVNLYAQYYPGEPRPPRDSQASRLAWFQRCLGRVGAVPGIRELALPHHVGCGLAGGDWDVYQKLIRDWARSSDLDRVVIVRKEEYGGRIA